MPTSDDYRKWTGGGGGDLLHEEEGLSYRREVDASKPGGCYYLSDLGL